MVSCQASLWLFTPQFSQSDIGHQTLMSGVELMLRCEANCHIFLKKLYLLEIEKILWRGNFKFASTVHQLGGVVSSATDPPQDNFTQITLQNSLQAHKFNFSSSSNFREIVGQPFSFLALIGFKISLRRLLLSDLLINYKAVCKTAPARPGLLNTFIYLTCYQI